MTWLSLKSTIIFFVLFQIHIHPQTFGFGCLGFPGAYGGYSYQKYKPDGLNESVRIFNLIRKDSLSESLSNFGQAQGFRVGVNFFRKKFSSVFITGKGYYQFLAEKHEALEKLFAGEVRTSYEVKITNWGLGIDLGMPIVSFLNWKIVDAALLYNQAKFSSTQNFTGSSTLVNNYKSDFKLGYSVGTGIVFELLGEYITLEGSAAYSSFTIDEMKSDNGTALPVNEKSAEAMRNFITDGGFNAVIQLNIGLPL